MLTYTFIMMGTILYHVKKIVLIQVIQVLLIQLIEGMSQ